MTHIIANPTSLLTVLSVALVEFTSDNHAYTTSDILPSQKRHLDLESSDNSMESRQCELEVLTYTFSAATDTFVRRPLHQFVCYPGMESSNLKMKGLMQRC